MLPSVLLRALAQFDIAAVVAVAAAVGCYFAVLLEEPVVHAVVVYSAVLIETLVLAIEIL